MAVWQVDFYIIPRGAVAAVTSAASPGELDSANAWADAAFPADYERRLDRIAPRGRAWSPAVETWGDEDGNRVDVVSNDGRVQSVLVRVDVRRLDSKFGAALLDFTRKLGALLLRRDGLIVEPTIAAYAGALRSSSAWKFAGDSSPAGSLGSYTAGEDDE